MASAILVREAPSGTILDGGVAGNVLTLNTDGSSSWAAGGGGGGALVSNLINGLAPLITTANGALLANAGGTAAGWALITGPNYVGGMREVADITARNAIPAANRDVGMTVYEVDNDKLWRLIGGILNANWVDVTIGLVSNVLNGIVPAVGTVGQILQSTGVAAAWAAPLTFDTTAASPTISQGGNVTNGATAQTMLLAAQSATGTTSVGGSLTLQSGTGTLAGVGTNTSPGNVTIERGTQTVASWVTAGGTDFIAFGLPAGSAGLNGNSSAATGTIRSQRASSWKARLSNDTGDVNIIDYGTINGSNSVTLGDQGLANGLTLASSGVGIDLRVNNSTKLHVDATNFLIEVGNVTFPNLGLNPIISQSNETTVITSQNMVIAAQGNVFAGSTGGDLILCAGAGTTANGKARLRIGGSGGVDKLVADSTGIGFYAHATAAQSADMVAITDTTTGAATTTVNDVGAVFSQAGLNNIHATLLTQINKVRTALRATGYMA